MTEHDPTTAVPAEVDAESPAEKQITTTHGAYALAALIALIAGVVIGTVAGPQVPTVVAPYLPIAVVAALIVWLGDQLGVGTQLSTAIVVVLGIRIFGNAAALRRRLFGA